MYGYIKGTITEIKSNSIVLENNEIGYLIYTANPYAFNENEIYKVYLYQMVKEDELSLFGFKKEEERELFLKLINVKGLGPKMALPILATGSIPGIIDAINRENILYLKKFPKSGDKLAKQIILDLKGKLGNISTDSNIEETTSTVELRDVLLGLGYKEKEVISVIPKIPTELVIEEQVKEALKLLLK